MNRKLLFVGVSLLSCFTSVHADDVLSHVIEYDGTQVSSRTDYTYDANGGYRRVYNKTKSERSVSYVKL